MSTLTALQALNAVFSKEQAEVILALIENNTTTGDALPPVPDDENTYTLRASAGEAYWHGEA